MIDVTVSSPVLPAGSPAMPDTAEKRFLRGSVPFAAATGIMVNEVMKFITSYDKEVGEAIEVE